MSAAGSQRQSLSSSLTLQRIALCSAAVLVVWALSHVVLIAFFAILLALAIRGTADWLADRTRTAPRFMLAAVSVCALLACVGLVYWIGPRLVAQGEDLASRLSTQLQSLHDHFGGTPIGQHVSSQLSSVGQRLVSTAETALGVGFAFAVDVVVVIVTTLYLAIHPELYIRGVLRLVPVARRGRALEVMQEVGRVLRLWVLGQLVDMATVAILTAGGLSLLGVPAPYALAALAGILTFVPYFGAVSAGIPAVLVAMTVGWMTALWTVVIFIACHLVEGYLVSPLVQRRLIELPPALTILGMTIAGVLFGSFGIVLGTPLAAAALVLVREFYVGDVLGDRGDRAPMRAIPDHSGRRLIKM